MRVEAMFFMPDLHYLLFLAPGMLLAAWAQFRVQSAFSEASRIPASSGASGAQAAAAVMHAAGISNVQIEPVDGYLSDHYSPQEKVLRLSPDVYAGRSLAALGVAAHEAGHAIQDANNYPLLVMRNSLVPMAGFGSQISWILIVVGFLISSFNLLMLGIGAFSLTVVFQLVNLPVEFDASRRARIALIDSGLVAREEDVEVGRVLNAAAWTYVAATLTSILTLLYYLFRAGLLGGRSQDD